MKLKLEKQRIESLSSSEMGSFNGGGRRRSMRLKGGCSYSRNPEHKREETDCITGKVYITSCS